MEISKPYTSYETKFVSEKAVKDATCPMCYREEETIMHILWSCPAARDVWAKKQSLVHKWYSKWAA